MIPEIRKKYNAAFTRDKYDSFLKGLSSSEIFRVEIPISETPLFLSDSLTRKLTAASEEIISLILTDEFKKYSMKAVPEEFLVPNEDEHSLFILLDFAVCRDDNDFYPRLIELQGFPSHFFFMSILEEKYRKYFPIPENLTPYFNGLSRSTYREFIRNILLDGSDPANTILLELDPEKQKSRIEFWYTLESTGITPVNILEIIKRKNKLYYKKNGKEIIINKIYSRLIRDELVRKGVKFNFKLSDELQVKWIGHPNWFFKISKYSLPFLKSKFVPEAFFLDKTSVPDDLENYVLKPLFSYSGKGVEVDITKETIDKIKDKSGYILHKKVEYAPLADAPGGFLKAEVRMMYIWPFRTNGGKITRPMLVNNLVRFGRAKKMGVDFNRDQSWAGMTLAYHSEHF